ncbi:MAG: hypothetical protein ACHQHN_11800 [Sphingobacteriales bacterium]
MWLDKLPIKKDYLLIAGSIFLLLIGYELAFKTTVDAWQTHKQLQAQLAQSTDLSYQPGYLERQNGNLDKIIALYKTDTTAFRSNSISAISLLAEKEQVKLNDVPVEDPVYHTARFTIQKLSFEGEFFNLLKFLGQLQKTSGIGIVRSVDFKIIGLHQGASDNKKLVLEIFLESVNS